MAALETDKRNCHATAATDTRNEVVDATATIGRKKKLPLIFFWPNSNKCTDAYVAIVVAEIKANMQICTSTTIHVMHS